MIRLFSILLLTSLCFSGEPAPAPNPEKKPAAPDPVPVAVDAEWKKIETKAVLHKTPKQVMSPGLFDAELRHVIKFPRPGLAMDLELPHAGLDKSGNKFPMFVARVLQGSVWVDVDNDGKPGIGESKPINPDGYTEPFTTELHYEGGTTAPYTFRMRAIIENEQYAVVRAMQRETSFLGEKIVLLDDDGNGKYNDIDRDCVIVGDQPVAFLGKYIAIKDQYYELLVQASGATIELRPAPKLAIGMIDPFKEFDFPQKSEIMRIHTIIFSGPEGSFACDDKRRAVKVPVGAYDLMFALFERGKETAYVKKGDKTSFKVEAEKVAAPKWGAPIKPTYSIDSDGQEVTLGPPQFIGQGSEIWHPEHFRGTPVTAAYSQIFKDSLTHVDRLAPAGNKKYEVTPNGMELNPVTFKCYRRSDDEYQMSVDYTSGIMGRISGKQKYSFVFKKKSNEKKSK